MKKIICIKCNIEFICNASDIKKCWCFSIATKKIDLNLKSCLCKTCLEKLN